MHKLYCAYEDNEYELPLCFSGTVDELVCALGIAPTTALKLVHQADDWGVSNVFRVNGEKRVECFARLEVVYVEEDPLAPVLYEDELELIMLLRSKASEEAKREQMVEVHEKNAERMRVKYHKEKEARERRAKMTDEEWAQYLATLRAEAEELARIEEERQRVRRERRVAEKRERRKIDTYLKRFGVVDC